MPTKDKIYELPQLLEKVKEWKSAGKRIVFTNGCFDIMHLGHVDYLEKAKAEGDILIVGLNSDLSTRNIKGPERPIVDENSRSRTLAAMEFVDAVVLFDEDTPYNLIKNILPDVLIKGKDYQIENIVGADIVIQNNGNIITIDLVEGYSTTKIFEKIRKIK
jgi:rfaE bifunctional protein nucleotidyltransferase chain/domain